MDEADPRTIESTCQVCGRPLIKIVGRRHPWMHKNPLVISHSPWPATWKVTPREHARKLDREGHVEAAKRLRKLAGIKDE